MNKRTCAFLIATLGWVAAPLWAQQPCPNTIIAIGTDEDRLMLAVNGADNPQEQLTALDAFAKDHADSKFMPCANEYYATINLKLTNYDKSIEYAEKDLAVNYQDLNLLLTLTRAYVASSKVSDTVFDAIDKVPDQAKAETTSIRPAKASDADWEKIQADAAELAKDSRGYAVYAFFQLLPRVMDGTKRVQFLDNFVKAYPEAEKDIALQINVAYLQAYQFQNNAPKIVEYGEKILASDPNNVLALNTLAFLNAFGLPQPNADKASEYAQKALTVAQGMKKPEGVDEAAFKGEIDSEMGKAHLSLGYAAMVKAGKTQKMGPAIEEFKTASSLLDANPALEGQALYYLAYAYENQRPANHHGAIDALSKAQTLAGPFQGPSHDLLVKVQAVATPKP